MSSSVQTDREERARDQLVRRKLKYYLRLNYPVRIWVSDERFHGVYPDLPDCRVEHDDIEALKSALDAVRRSHLTDRILCGLDPPMPNTHLED